MVLSGTDTFTSTTTIDYGTLVLNTSSGSSWTGGTFQVTSGTGLVVNGAFNESGTSAVTASSGFINVSSGATFTSTYEVTLTASHLNVNGTFTDNYANGNTTPSLLMGSTTGNNITVGSMGTVSVAELFNTITGNSITDNGSMSVSGVTKLAPTATSANTFGLNGTGTLNLATFNIAGNTAVTSTMTTLNISGPLNLGYVGGGGALPSTFNQSAGTVNFTSPTAGTVCVGNGLLGQYNLTGGILNVLSSPLVVSNSSGLSGNAGGGTLNIIGGTANLNGLSLAPNATGTSTVANFNLTGGTVNLGTYGIKAGAAGTRNSSLGAGTLGVFGGNWSSSENFLLTSPATGVTMNTTDSVDGVTGRTITLSGTLSGSGSLNLTGQGMLILSGADTYTGLTNLISGTLEGGGNGSLLGNVSAGAATIEPGGTLSIGGLTTNGLSDLSFDLGVQTGTDTVTLGDLLDIGSIGASIAPGTSITFSSSGLQVGDWFRLIGGSDESALVSSGQLSNFTLPAAPAGETYSLSSTVDPGYIDLVVSASPVPEPTAMGALGVLATGLLGRKRRR